MGDAHQGLGIAVLIQETAAAPARIPDAAMAPMTGAEMARYSSAYRTSGVATNLLPMASIYATAAVRPRVVEVSVFNTTATAVNVALCRLTTAGTSSAVATGGYEDDNSQPTPITTPRNTHSSTGPTIAGILRMADLGAAIGSGVIWTFGGGKTSGVVIPNTTGDGLGLYTPNGTGQICSVTWTWDE